MSWKKFWVKIHNYLGLLLSLFFLLLFGSGIVMMFVGYPRYYDPHRLPELPELESDAIEVSLAEAYRASGLSSSPGAVRLNTLQGRPVYRFKASDGSYRLVFADNADRVNGVKRGFARRSVEWYKRINDVPGSIETAHKMIDVDPWTTNPGFSGTDHWPFYKFELSDPSGTELYVSSRTGEIMHKTTFWQRFWGYLGPVVHYFYVPTNLRQFPDLWYNVVVFVSGFGSIVCGLGIVIGVMFLRWKQLARWCTRWTPWGTKEPTKPVSPYEGWLEWHNYFGLVFGFLALTWMFSGMMSMNPLQWHDWATVTEAERTRWSGKSLDLSASSVGIKQALESCGKPIRVKEIRLKQLRGEPYYYCLEDADETRVVSAGEKEPGQLRERFSFQALRAHAPRLIPGESIKEITWLTDYDSYYHLDRSVRIGDTVKPLPVMRVKYDDPPESWFYVNPYDGSIISHYRTRSRWNRWLFDGLHTLDVGWLYEDRRPLWWFVMILFMTGGLALSVTGVWLTVGWLVGVVND